MPAVKRIFSSVAVMILVAAALGSVPTRVGAAADEPVLWVHGIVNTLDACRGMPGDPGVHADTQAAPLKSVLASDGQTPPVIGVKYYCGDTATADITNCAGPYGHFYDNSVPIERLALDLACYINKHYSQYGQYVSIVGHSMGGLIAEYAVTHAGQPGWPSVLVHTVVTYSTPNGGADKTSPALWAASCGIYEQCNEMLPGSAFLTSLAAAPMPSSVRLVTVGGGPADNVDSYASSTRPDAYWSINYFAKSPVDYSHTSYITDTSMALTEPYTVRSNGATTTVTGVHSLLAGCRALEGASGSFPG